MVLGPRPPFSSWVNPSDPCRFNQICRPPGSCAHVFNYISTAYFALSLRPSVAPAKITSLFQRQQGVPHPCDGRDFGGAFREALNLVSELVEMGSPANNPAASSPGSASKIWPSDSTFQKRLVVPRRGDASKMIHSPRRRTRELRS
jgi:hypothetical protein